MKVLKISNPGLVNVKQLIYMGCSTKNGVDTIGKFGTGAKYSIATLLRNNIDFNIYIGKEKVDITTKLQVIDGEEFESIVINGKETSLLTNLGVEWEVWQSVREFIANSIDRGGFYDIVDSEDIFLNDSETTVTF